MSRVAAVSHARRRLLGALAGAVGLPLLGRAAAPAPRVGIIGGGMAGMACAWLVDGICDVVLFEGREALGGNVRSLELVVDGHPYVVDAGAQFFHPGPYPTYVQLLELLGLYPPATGGSHAFPASITVAEPSEATPRFVSPVLPGRAWPLLAPWNRPGIQAFATNRPAS
jgi:monoamine oxidase